MVSKNWQTKILLADWMQCQQRMKLKTNGTSVNTKKKQKIKGKKREPEKVPLQQEMTTQWGQEQSIIQSTKLWTANHNCVNCPQWSRQRQWMQEQPSTLPKQTNLSTPASLCKQSMHLSTWMMKQGSSWRFLQLDASNQLLMKQGSNAGRTKIMQHNQTFNQSCNQWIKWQLNPACKQQRNQLKKHHFPFQLLWLVSQLVS